VPSFVYTVNSVDTHAEVRKQTALQIHYTQPGGITGHFMLLIMFLMYTTAHHKIRQQCFEAFWYTHHLAFFFMIGLYTHATGCFVRDSVLPDYTASFPFYSTEHCLGYESWRYIIWPGIIYFGERMYREYRARRATRLSKVLVHPSGAMELRIVKPTFKYTVGQWLFIQVPEISRWQWHPVSSLCFAFESPNLTPLCVTSSLSRLLLTTIISPSTSVKSVTSHALSVIVLALAHPLSQP